MGSFLVRSLLCGAGAALVPFAASAVIACGDSFRGGSGDGEQTNQGDASMGDGGSSSSGGASSGGTKSTSSGGSASGGVTGSTATSGGAGSGAGGAGNGGVQPATTGGRPSIDGGSDAGAPEAGGTSAGGNTSTGGKPSTGGNAATGGTANTGGAGGNPTVAAPPTSGMMLWLRADKGITASNSIVSKWADQSASHLDAVQATARMQPLLLPDGINGHPALVFDGVDDFLQIPTFDVETGAVTVFAVTLMPDTGVCSAIFESSNGAEDNDISLGSYQNTVNWEVLATADENTSFDEGVPVIIGASATPDGTGYVVKNGVVGSTLTNYESPAKLQRLQTFIGKTLYASCQTFPGRIGEVIVYNRALSLEEILGVQKYLGAEFGCCLN
jgi:hypothetical protein